MSCTPKSMNLQGHWMQVFFGHKVMGQNKAGLCLLKKHYLCLLIFYHNKHKGVLIKLKTNKKTGLWLSSGMHISFEFVIFLNGTQKDVTLQKLWHPLLAKRGLHAHLMSSESLCLHGNELQLAIAYTFACWKCMDFFLN